MSKNIKILLSVLAILGIIGYLLQVFFPEEDVFTPSTSTTPPTTQAPIEMNFNKNASTSATEIGEQGRLDIEFNEKIAKHVEKYPWYEDFPVITQEYTIVYDYDLKSFRIRLQIPEFSPLEKKVNAQEKAVEVLKNKLTNFDEWEYHFLYSEK